MKRKDINYKFARENLYNKDLYLRNYIDDMLTKCNQMFVYENLPTTTPKRIIEQYLLESGYCIFTKYNDKYVVLQGGLGGELNEYYEYTQVIVSNPYLKLEKTFTINDDCIIMRNDCKMRGILHILSKYAVLCNDCEITLNMITNNLRAQWLLSAGDNRTKASADKFIDDLYAGRFATIAENTFLEGVKLHSTGNQASNITQFIELAQYLRATAYNEIGLDAQYNMKRERLNVNEVMLNSSILIPLLDDMLEQRKIAVNSINEKYGLNIKVELASIWKMQKESVDNAINNQKTDTEIDSIVDTETEKDSDTRR